VAGTGADIADHRKGCLDLRDALNGLDTAAVALVMQKQAIAQQRRPGASSSRPPARSQNSSEG
jgi:hypothetical protein